MRTIVFALAGASALAIGTIQSASAADIPRPVVKAPVMVAAYSWTGFYIGVHGGYGWANGDVGIGITDPTGIAQAVAAAGGFPVSYSFDRDGYVAGGQIGYNQQMGQWLWGVEADISATGIRGSQSVLLPTCAICTLPNASSASQDMDWFGTVRGRLGFVASNWLFFGTGGLAYGHVKYAYSQTNVPFGGGVNIAGSASEVEVGWTLGAGVEYGWGPWSAKAEYLYYDLGDASFTVPHNLVPAIVQFTPQFENKGSIVRAGFNYRLN
jgi:outer membrane immunogenic protein